MRIAGALIAIAATGVTTAPVLAQGIVISSRGPDAVAFPPGKKIALGERISLRAGSFISALGETGTHVFKGPGRFAFGAPFRRIAFDSLYAKALIDPTRRTRIISRAAAVRASVPVGQRDWRDIDISTPGRVCINSAVSPRFWRPDANASLSIDVVQSGDAKPVRVSFAKGDYDTVWPERLHGRLEGMIKIGRADSAPLDIDLVIIDDREVKPLELAASLISAGCSAQAETLIAQMEAAPSSLPSGGRQE